MVSRATFEGANSTEILEWMVAGGYAPTACSVLNSLVVVDAPGDEAALQARLDAFTPQPGWQPTVPVAVRDAVVRLRARAGAGDAVARDCLILFRFLHERLDQ